MSIHAGHRQAQLIIISSLIKCEPNLVLPLCANEVCWQRLSRDANVGEEGQLSLLTF